MGFIYAFKIKCIFQWTDECELDYTLWLAENSEDFGPTDLLWATKCTQWHSISPQVAELRNKEDLPCSCQFVC